MKRYFLNTLPIICMILSLCSVAQQGSPKVRKSESPKVSADRNTSIHATINEQVAKATRMANDIVRDININEIAALAPMPPMPPMPAMESLAAIAPVGSINFSDAPDAIFYTNSGKKFTDADDVKSKEISQELSVSKTADIYIDNTSRNIVIKQWDQPKVKVTTTVFYEGDGKLSDEEWFEKLNLSLRMLGSSVKIKSGSISGGSYTISGQTYGWSSVGGSGNQGGVAVFNGSGQNIGTKSNVKRIVTVYVPSAAKLDIESKYADVQVDGKYSSANIDITNGNLDAGSFNKLILRSKYSNVSMDDAETAEVEFINGRFSAKNVDDADLDTKYSTVEIAAVKKVIFRSTNDEYEIEEAGDIRGRKNYGNMRITKLNTSLEVDGTNADIKVRNAGANLSLIRIDNKYADIRLPLRNIKNYAINFVGPYSSVYGNFDRIPLKEEPKAATTGSSKSKLEDDIANTIRSVNRAVERTSFEENTNTRFSAVVGDGKGLKIDMKCQNCTVDFK
ncbi:MAG: DUF4097 domain-containing protein [Chitinophagaceae bacterium]|nr:DUF4097 domain-containing protein [Chitinophagaceae bacterium]